MLVEHKVSNSSPCFLYCGKWSKFLSPPPEVNYQHFYGVECQVIISAPDSQGLDHVSLISRLCLYNLLL